MGFELSQTTFTVPLSNISCLAPSGVKRANGSLLAARLRLREERKKYIDILDAKYRKIDDHELSMRHFVLLRNCIRRLEREVRDEKMARGKGFRLGESRANFSPSSLSASRATSPMVHCYDAQPAAQCDEDTSDAFDCPPKRPRLYFHDDKENDMDVDPTPELSAVCKQPADQEILNDLYETCSNDSFIYRPFSTTPSAWSSAPSLIETTPSSQCPSTFSLAYSLSPTADDSHQSTFQQSCGQSSLFRNDFHSVVYHSLLTSLES